MMKMERRGVVLLGKNELHQIMMEVDMMLKWILMNNLECQFLVSAGVVSPWPM